jgi:hypothetical protein
VQERRGGVPQPGLHRRQQPEVPHPPADHVLPGLLPDQRAGPDQLGDQAVRGGQREPGAAGERGQGQAAVLLVVRAEQIEHP